MIDEIKIDKRLRSETEVQRRALSKIGEADIALCRARAAALSTPGRIYHPETGEEIVVSASVTRALFETTGSEL